MMRRFSRNRVIRAVSEYWDEVSHRAPATPVPGADVPAELTTLIRQLHARGSTAPAEHPAPDPLLSRLLAKHKELSEMESTTFAPRDHISGQWLDARKRSSASG